MSFPYARTYDEVNLYLSLRPCVCGETEFEDQTRESVLLGAVAAERFSCYCLGCARLREFTFQMSDRPREVSFDIRYGADDEPSRLIDAGEWMAVSELYGLAAAAELDGDPIENGDEVASLYYTLTSAIAASMRSASFSRPARTSYRRARSGRRAAARCGRRTNRGSPARRWPPIGNGSSAGSRCSSAVTAIPGLRTIRVGSAE